MHDKATCVNDKFVCVISNKALIATEMEQSIMAVK